MSMQRLAEAWALECSPAAKLAALYIGDSGCTTTYFMPVSISGLASFTGVHIDTARELLRDLIWIGFLENAQPHDDDQYMVWFPWFDDPRRPVKKKNPVSKEARAYVQERGKNCVYCGCEEGPYHIDHIIPRSRGGDNDISNLALACATCNVSKRDKLIIEWDGPKDRDVDFTRVTAIQEGRA